MNRIKKGFTVVELVVVIAVIGILVSILIPTMSSLSRKAQNAVDVSLIKNLNESLVLAYTVGGNVVEPKTMHEMLTKMDNEQGFGVAKLQTRYKDNVLLWDSKKNKFLLETKQDGESVYVDNTGELNYSSGDLVNLWVISSKISDTYSTYLYKYTGAPTIQTKKGLDIGDVKTVSSINYIGDTTTQDVIIRTTDNMQLTIDAESDSVKHYGEGSSLIVDNIAVNSYHEFGEFKNAQIKKGRIVLETSESKIDNLLIIAKAQGFDTVKLETKQNATLPKVATSQAPVGANGSLVLSIVENGKNPEFIYLKSDNTTVVTSEEIDTTSIDVSNSSKVIEASSAVATVAQAVASEENRATAEEIALGTEKFAGGAGTIGSPYLIATPTQWSNINTLSFDGEKSYNFKQVNDLEVVSAINKFAGSYDGDNFSLTQKLRFTSSNYYFLFGELTGHALLKNINVLMKSNHATALLNYADWDSFNGLDVENVTFNATKPISVNSTNFGLVVINALWPVMDSENVVVEYNFKDITNNVSLTNAGTCVGMIIGSGPCFEDVGVGNKAIINYENCTNNGNIVGTDYVGFLYGNPSYMNNSTAENTEINVTNCKNNASFSSTKGTANVHFAPERTGATIPTTLNNEYQAQSGGVYMTSNRLAGVTTEIHQDGTAFTINASNTSYTYKMALNVQAIYFTVNGEVWEGTLADKENGTDYYVVNGSKYFIDLPLDTRANGTLNSFHAYDARTARVNGIEVSFANNQDYVIVEKDGVNYMVFNRDNTYYIDSNVVVLIYAYDNNELVGVK